MEPIIAFVMCGVIFVVTRVYLRYVQKEAAPHPEFEKWIAGRPLVAALRVRPGTEVEAVFTVRALLGKAEFFNPGGGYPWQHYIVTFTAKELGGGVVGVFATHAAVARVTAKRPDFETILTGIGREVTTLDEIWLHGWTKTPGIGHVADRHRMSWCGAFTETGALDVTAMIGQPPWLVERRAA
jgi:hypothetical protein